MRFHRATLKEQRTLSGIFLDEGRSFPAGTEVSATEAGPERWHLNADHNGEAYDGYAPSAALEVGEVIATCNEGA